MKEWRNRDWCWLTGILFTLILILMIAIFYDDYRVKSFIAFTSHVVSIVLAIIAIIYAMYQTVDSSRKNGQLIDILNAINKEVVAFATLKDIMLTQDKQQEKILNHLSEAKDLASRMNDSEVIDKIELIEKEYESSNEIINSKLNTVNSIGISFLLLKSKMDRAKKELVDMGLSEDEAKAIVQNSFQSTLHTSIHKDKK